MCGRKNKGEEVGENRKGKKKREGQKERGEVKKKKREGGNPVQTDYQYAEPSLNLAEVEMRNPGDPVC